jgi:hypothetical protein
MGLFGNLGEAYEGIRNAFSQLLYRPLDEENLFLGLIKGSLFFVRGSALAVTGSIGSILNSFKTGIHYVFSAE